MKITKGEMAVFGIALAAFLVGACFYPYLPERMASHWNAKGQVDGYMPKGWGAFLMPIFILGLGLPFMVIVRIDPLKANIAKFRKYYDGFVILFSVFLFCMNLWMLLWNVGYKLSLNIVIPIGIGLLIFYTGVLCENAKRNWFIGIRTPWTLSSDIVWDRTHRIGGILFKAVGIVILAGVFWPGYLCWFIIVPMVLVSVFLIVYSYVVYQKVGEIDASAGRLNDASGNGTWDSVKAGYLNQVQKALALAGHREKKQVLEDVRSHLDQRFSELGPDEQTWENMQAIITEMGPATDYAELMETGTPKSNKKKVFVSVAVIVAVVAVATIFVPHLIVKYTEMVSDRIEDNIDFPFVDDPEVIGKWTSVDFVDGINDFDPGIKRWRSELFLNELVFHENGRILSKNDNAKNGFWLKWTRGIVICPDDKTAEKYHIEEIDGEKYMFYEWKSGDYTVRHRKPHYYVLKKEPVETDIAVVDFKVHPCYDDQLRAKGFYNVTASIRNKGEQQTGQFGVYFYRGDPATSKPRTHAAGPIKSGGTWNEYTGPFELKEGTNVFSVVIDPGNDISDPDRSNNTKTITVTVKDGRIIEKTKLKSISPQVKTQDKDGQMEPIGSAVPPMVVATTPVAFANDVSPDLKKLSVRQAAADGRISFKLTTPDEFKAIVGQPTKEWTEDDGDEILMEYPGIRVKFVGKPEMNILHKIVHVWCKEGGGIDIGQDRPITLRYEEDLDKFESIMGYRGVDLSRLDLSRKGELVKAMPFDSFTIWPESDRLPPDFDPKVVMEWGKYPGLRVKQLHDRGVTGKAVHVAIIDQPLLLDHIEYKDQLASYTDIQTGNVGPSMHGAAVASLLVGKTCGTAPGAILHFWAQPSWKGDFKYRCTALEQIIQFNRGKEKSEQIRILSVSKGFSRDEPNLDRWKTLLEKAKQSGIYVVHCGSMGFGAGCRFLKDSDNPANYRLCAFYDGGPVYGRSGTFFSPIDNRTIACDKAKGAYTFWPEGGLSWGAPYIAGVVALGMQVNPDLSVGQIDRLLYESGWDFQRGKLINPKKFISMARMAETEPIPENFLEEAKPINSAHGELVAVDSARHWLGFIDDGDYGASWEAAADIFKNAATKEGWENMAKMVREPLGKVISREVMTKMPTKTLPGGPDGEYVIIQFRTSFENKKDAIETVTPMLDKDGIWRMTGYYIR